MTLQQPLQIAIKDIPHSEAIEARIRGKIDKLTEYFDNITSCTVVVELIKKHMHAGKLYNVEIRMTVPGRKEIIASRNRQKNQKNLWLAIKDAYDEMKKQLKFRDQRIHGKVKTHPEELHGEVVRLFEDYGFIETSDGTEYYFNFLNVTKPKFDKLRVGTPVHFIEGLGYETLQAHRVHATRRRAA